jgi:hypothetical protein
VCCWVKAVYGKKKFTHPSRVLLHLVRVSPFWKEICLSVGAPSMERIKLLLHPLKMCVEFGEKIRSVVQFGENQAGVRVRNWFACAGEGD